MGRNRDRWAVLAVYLIIALGVCVLAAALGVLLATL